MLILGGDENGDLTVSFLNMIYIMDMDEYSS